MHLFYTSTNVLTHTIVFIQTMRKDTYINMHEHEDHLYSHTDMHSCKNMTQIHTLTFTHMHWQCPEMSCSHCSSTIEKELKKLAGVQNVAANATTKDVEVQIRQISVVSPNAPLFEGFTSTTAVLTN